MGEEGEANSQKEITAGGESLRTAESRGVRQGLDREYSAVSSAGRISVGSRTGSGLDCGGSELVAMTKSGGG